MPRLQRTCVPAAPRPVEGGGGSRRPTDPQPPVPTLGLVRVVRASTLGGLSLLLAAGAHLLGGGSLPGLGVLLVAAVLLALLAAVVTARRVRLGLLLALLAGEQLGLHALFSLAGAASACTVSGAETVHAVGHHVAATCGAGGMVMTSSVPGWLMWAGHLVAVALTAWLLARGEAWLWRAVDRVAAAAGLRGPVRLAGRGGRPAPVHPGALLLPRVWSTAAPRGPPCS